MSARRPTPDPWVHLFPAEMPEYHLTDRLRRLVERWEEMPFNAPGADKTWVERLLDSHARQRAELAAQVE